MITPYKHGSVQVASKWISFAGLSFTRYGRVCSSSSPKKEKTHISSTLRQATRRKVSRITFEIRNEIKTICEIWKKEDFIVSTVASSVAGYFWLKTFSKIFSRSVFRTFWFLKKQIKIWFELSNEESMMKYSGNMEYM